MEGVSSVLTCTHKDLNIIEKIALGRRGREGWGLIIVNRFFSLRENRFIQIQSTEASKKKNFLLITTIHVRYVATSFIQHTLYV